MFGFSVSVYGQGSDQSVFGGITLKSGNALDNTCYFTGGKGGWQISKYFSVGFGFYGLSSNVVKDHIIDPATERFIIHSNYGGLEFGTGIELFNKLSVSFVILCGGGGIETANENKKSLYQVVYRLNYLIWEPQINLEYRLFPWLSCAAGVTHRFITDYTSVPTLSPGPLKGTTFSVTLLYRTY